MTTETKRQMRLEDIDALNTMLNKIWKMGDRDEMSIKHIGHGLASFVATGDSGNRLDYETPDVEMTDKAIEKLESLWRDVESVLYGVSREECIAVFEYLPIANYGAIYLDLEIWPEYAQRHTIPTLGGANA
jgi:hypothetical protein